MKGRPAETSAPVAVAIAYLIGRAAGLDAETVGYLSIVVAFVPFAVSWAVDRYRDARATEAAVDRARGRRGR